MSGIEKVQIQNAATIAKVADELRSDVNTPESKYKLPEGKGYFERMNISGNVRLDDGPYGTIYVQPDQRYIYNFIQYHISELYKDLDYSVYPYVSAFTLTGYCLTLVDALMLYSDLYYSTYPSHQAAEFKNCPAKTDLFQKILSCTVPPFLEPLLREIAPAKDPRRTKLQLTPGFGGYSDLHDFGKTIPPALFFKTHDFLTKLAPNIQPEQARNDLLQIVVQTYDGTVERKICNYMGFSVGDTFIFNWVNDSYLAKASTLTMRNQSGRCGYASIELRPEDVNSFSRNIYSALLLASESNIRVATNLYDALSYFTKQEMEGKTTLESICTKLQGSCLFNYIISGPILPTWSMCNYTAKGTSSSTSLRKFADKNGFLVPEKEYNYSFIVGATKPKTTPASTKSKTLDPPKSLDQILQNVEDGSTPTDNEQIENVDQNQQPESQVREATDDILRHYVRGTYTPGTSGNINLQYVAFTHGLHTRPLVYYFCPYDNNSSILNWAIGLGMYIEIGDIAGFVQPIEHMNASLHNNNSVYKNSAIAISAITPANAYSSPTEDPVRISQVNFFDLHSVTVVTRAYGSTDFPIIGNENVERPPTIENLGMRKLFGINSLSEGFNVRSGTTASLPMGTKKLYAWSPYRLVDIPTVGNNPNISMIVTFRTIYGTNVTLKQTVHPTLLIPY